MCEVSLKGPFLPCEVPGALGFGEEILSPATDLLHPGAAFLDRTEQFIRRIGRWGDLTEDPGLSGFSG